MPEEFKGIHVGRRESVIMPITSAAALELPDFRADGMFLFMVGRVPKAREQVAKTALTAAYRNCCAIAPNSVVMSRPNNRKVIVDPREAPMGLDRYTSPDATPHVAFVDASHGLRWNSDFRATYRPVMIMVFAGVIILLVLSCANIGTLLLTRALTRKREFGIRLAIGATRVDLMRQVLGESLVLSIAGGMLGMAIANAANGALLKRLPPSLGALDQLLAWRTSWPVLAFTGGTVLVCTFFFGLWPAYSAGKTDLLTPLKRSVPALTWHRIEYLLAVFQVSLAIVLACAASILIGSLGRLGAINGDQAANTVIAMLTVDHPSADPAVQGALFDRITRQTKALAGVSEAAVVLDAPLVMDMYAPGPEIARGGQLLESSGKIRFVAASAGYFNAFGARMLRGAGFNEFTRDDGEPVAVVSKRFADEVLHSADPVGTTFDVRSEVPFQVRVVGLVSDVAYDEDPKDTQDAVWYMPVGQAIRKLDFSEIGAVSLVVKTTQPARQLKGAISTDIGYISSDVGVRSVSTEQELLEDALVRERLAAGLGGMFGLVALLLVAIGLYGLLAHRGVARTSEIGIRVALGANRWNVLLMMLRQTGIICVIGLVVGVPLSFAFVHAARAEVFNIDTHLAGTMALSTCVVLVIAALASLWPSYAATKVDPLLAIKSQD
jgi:predicted permease